MGGLFTSLMAFATFLIASYQKFEAQKSMLKRLYGEEDFDAVNNTVQSNQLSNSTPK